MAEKASVSFVVSGVLLAFLSVSFLLMHFYFRDDYEGKPAGMKKFLAYDMPTYGMYGFGACFLLLWIPFAAMKLSRSSGASIGGSVSQPVKSGSPSVSDDFSGAM